MSLERLAVEDLSDSSPELRDELDDMDDPFLRSALISVMSGAFKASAFVVERKVGVEIMLPVTSLPVRFLTVPERMGVGGGDETSARFPRIVNARAIDILESEIIGTDLSLGCSKV